MITPWFASVREKIHISKSLGQIRYVNHTLLDHGRQREDIVGQNCYYSLRCFSLSVLHYGVTTTFAPAQLPGRIAALPRPPLALSAR